jgi:hypothetical protein
LILYTHSLTPRLQYICDFIANEWLPGKIDITSSLDKYQSYNGLKINYSHASIPGNELWIIPHGLLAETGIRPQETSCFETENYKAFFKTGGEFPFDCLASSFYLLSRYEEYLPHSKDSYGRYGFENSLAYKEKFLNLPLVNIWMDRVVDLLKRKFPETKFKARTFTFLPTYDIDIAWSYKHKGWWRNLGGLLRSCIKGEWTLIKERIRVLRGNQKDPFDSFGWLNSLHEKYRLKPYYFFLVAEKRGRYDKNISPSSAVMKTLISDHATRYPIGIHPSWLSGDDDQLLKKEIETLSSITGGELLSSRQHYIRFNLPSGYRRLIEAGIRFDFSMGYGSINGFRASVASPFYWYDLEKDQPTELMLFPFCYMEANSFYEQKYSPTQALVEMKHYSGVVKMVSGYFIMIWHNSFLGTDQLYAGWKEVYEEFLKEMVIESK